MLIQGSGFSTPDHPEKFKNSIFSCVFGSYHPEFKRLRGGKLGSKEQPYWHLIRLD